MMQMFKGEILTNQQILASSSKFSHQYFAFELKHLSAFACNIHGSYKSVYWAKQYNLVAKPGCLYLANT